MSSSKLSMSDKPKVRSDAKKNRDHLISVAQLAFGEFGASAPLELIAKRAGVGIGTLYRHFPSREELLAAALMSRMSQLTAKASDLCSSPLTALTFFDWLRSLVVFGTTYDGLPEGLRAVWTLASDDCAALEKAGAELLSRAQGEGYVRTDISFEELSALAAGIALALQRSDIGRSSHETLFDVLEIGLTRAGR